MNAQLPVVRVTVMEDRAQVEREGTLTLPGGVTRLEIPNVAAVAVDRSLKVEVKGGTFIDAKIVRRWKEVPALVPAADASEAEKNLHALKLKDEGQHDEMGRLESRRDLLVSTRADVLRSISEAVGAGTGNADSWKSQLALVSEAQAKAESEIHAAQLAIEATHREISELQRVIALSQQPTRTSECVLALTLDGSGQATVRVSYLVPCAVWRPSYRATLREKPNGSVLFEAEAMVWQRTGEPWNNVALAFSTARPTLGLDPAELSEDRLHTRAKSQQEKREVEVSFREEDIQQAGEASNAAPGMPGLDDGGEARLMKAPHAATIPSDGQPYRVPLFSFESAATVERVCTAPLSTLASTVARFTNSANDVVLAGPVDLIRQSGFVGRSTVKFTAPGELAALSFGSDDGIRVVRTVESSSKEAMLTGKKTTTTQVKLSVSNSSRDATRLFIEERIPVSEVKEVEVTVNNKECKPMPSSISKEGIVRFDTSLPANGTQMITFTWELVAASKVTGA